MIWLTPQERKALWEEYPEVQELYEEYNGILPEDDGAWERVAERCHQIRESMPDDASRSCTAGCSVAAEMSGKEKKIVKQERSQPPAGARVYRAS